MTPRPGVLATPELVDMVDFVPEAYYPMLPFNRWLLPNLNPATVSSWKEYLDQKRSEMVISWCGFMLLPSRQAIAAIDAYKCFCK